MPTPNNDPNNNPPYEQSIIPGDGVTWKQAGDYALSFLGSLSMTEALEMKEAFRLELSFVEDPETFHLTVSDYAITDSLAKLDSNDPEYAYFPSDHERIEQDLDSSPSPTITSKVDEAIQNFTDFDYQTSRGFELAYKVLGLVACSIAVRNAVVHADSILFDNQEAFTVGLEFAVGMGMWKFATRYFRPKWLLK